MIGQTIADPLVWFIGIALAILFPLVLGFLYGLWTVARGNDLPNQDDIDEIRNESD